MEESKTVGGLLAELDELLDGVKIFAPEGEVDEDGGVDFGEDRESPDQARRIVAKVKQLLESAGAGCDVCKASLDHPIYVEFGENKFTNLCSWQCTVAFAMVKLKEIGDRGDQLSLDGQVKLDELSGRLKQVESVVDLAPEDTK